MSKQKFNSFVGLEGYKGSSNVTGTTSLLGSPTYSTTSLLGSTSLSTSGTIFSTTSAAEKSDQQIATLQTERTTVSNTLLAAQTRLATIQAERNSCKGWTGLWNNDCLNKNTALQNEQNSIMAACQARLVAIDAEITKIQAEAAAIRQAEQEAAAKAAGLAAQAAANQIALIQAEAMANPEVAAILKNAEVSLFEAKENSKVLIAAGIAALLLIVGVLYFIFK